MASPRPAVRRSRPQPPTTAPRPIAAAISSRAAAIVLAGMLAYANSLSAPFIFDDNATVVQNTHIRDWHPAVALFPAREMPTAGRPIVNVSFAVNYMLGGLNVTGYRVTNIGIHVLCALVLFGLVQRTVSPPSRPGGTEVPR